MGRVLATLCSIGLLGVGAPLLAEDEVQDWTDRNLVTLAPVEAAGTRSGLRFLDALVGDARVVALGEALHGSHEFLELRNRMFAYLVEKQGFTAMAAETDFIDGTLVDDFVNGHGVLTPALVAGVFSFTAPVAAAENRELLDWMRDFNSRHDAGQRIHFYGIDMMGRSLQHEQPVVTRPLETALHYLAGVEARQARRFERRLRPIINALNDETGRSLEPLQDRATVSSPYSRLTGRQRERLASEIAALNVLFERRRVRWVGASSDLDYERAYRSAVNAKAIDADLRANGWWLGCWKHGARCDPDQRDLASAANLGWALQREGPRGRIFLFAHDTHIRMGVAAGSDGVSEFTSLGQRLRTLLGPGIVGIGSVYEQARGFSTAPDAWYDSVTPMLSGTGKDAGVLILRNFPRGAVSSWWMRNITDSRGRTLNPADCFDALVFLRTVTPSKAAAP